MEESKEVLELEKKNQKMNKEYEKIESKMAKKKDHLVEKENERERKKPIKEAKKKRRKELRKLSNPPIRPVKEEVGNAVTHGVGAILAIVGFILILIKSDTPLKILASIVYGICMFLTMLMSCLYHSFKAGSKVKFLWRRFDYSSIYLLIGGTFAPIYLVYWGNTLGIVLFIVQWVLIIIGITFVSIFGPGRIRLLYYIMYFAIGWSGIVFLPDFIKNNPPLLGMILGGGIVYTFGMIPFAKKGVKNAHFIWHFFVLAGAIVQFLGILLFIY